MLGAIVGDIVGSRFEWNNIKTKEFDLFTPECKPTDDSIMTLAIAKAILSCEDNYTELSRHVERWMQDIGRQYPDCGYGGAFEAWVFAKDPAPYDSYGNGAAMRVSPVAYLADSDVAAKLYSAAVTRVTHDNAEGLKGAEATTLAIYLALTGKSLQEIKDYIDQNYYPMNFTLDGIRDTYTFNETCQGSVPQALMAFFESTGFEDAIRNAISIGGDSDTLAAICGSVAEAYYGIPSNIRDQAITYLDEQLLQIATDFEAKFPPKIA